MGTAVNDAEPSICQTISRASHPSTVLIFHVCTSTSLFATSSGRGCSRYDLYRVLGLRFRAHIQELP